MQNIGLLLLLAVSCVGLAKAQDSTGEAAERVKQDVLKLEEEKLQAFRSSATPEDYTEDWVKRHDAANIVHVMPDGRMRSKDQLMAELRTGNRKVYSLKYGPQDIRVYGNGGDGTVAVSTYLTEATVRVRGGKPSNDSVTAIDVWYKQDGKWWFIVHSVHSLPPKKADKPLTK